MKSKALPFLILLLFSNLSLGQKRESTEASVYTPIECRTSNSLSTAQLCAEYIEFQSNPTNPDSVYSNVCFFALGQWQIGRYSWDSVKKKPIYSNTVVCDQGVTVSKPIPIVGPRMSQSASGGNIKIGPPDSTGFRLVENTGEGAGTTSPMSCYTSAWNNFVSAAPNPCAEPGSPGSCEYVTLNHLKVSGWENSSVVNNHIYKFQGSFWVRWSSERGGEASVCVGGVRPKEGT